MPMARKPTSIPRLADDAEYASAASLMAKFDRKFREVDARLKLLTLQHSLGPDWTDKGTTSDAALTHQLRQLREMAEPPDEAPVQTPDEPAIGDDAILNGLKLLHGEIAPPPPDLPQQITAARRDLQVIEAACTVQAEIVEEIRGRKNYDIGVMLRGQNNDLLAAVYHAALGLARASAAVRQFHAAVAAAGYRSRSDLIPEYGLRSAAILGREEDHSSELATLRRFLEDRGAI